VILYVIPNAEPTFFKSTIYLSLGFTPTMLEFTLTLLSVAASQPDLLRFVAHTTEPSPRSGRLNAIRDGWTVGFADAGAADLAGSLVSLRREGVSIPPKPREPMIILANGDRVRGEVASGDARSLHFVPWLRDGRDLKPWSVPLTALAVIWFTPPPADTTLDPAAYPWASGPRRRDVVLLRNGDVIRGTIEGFSADPVAVRIKPTGETNAQSILLSRIAAVAFDPVLARINRPKEPYARLVTADGSRISLAAATSDDNTLMGTTLFGAEIELPVAEIVALDVYQGKATYLSDLKPRKATVDAFGGLTWPWAADRTVKGQPLRIGEQLFDKGLGTHPHTTLVYDLDERFRRFEAVVGLDPVTGRRGAVDVRVLVDGKEVTIPGLSGLTAASSPQTIAVDVTGAKELMLVVDYGPGGDVQDDVNWGDARLIE
jgi:hypothetical protein